MAPLSLNDDYRFEHNGFQSGASSQQNKHSMLEMHQTAHKTGAIEAIRN
jgi:hypothetical protein